MTLLHRTVRTREPASLLRRAGVARGRERYVALRWCRYRAGPLGVLATTYVPLVVLAFHHRSDPCVQVSARLFDSPRHTRDDAPSPQPAALMGPSGTPKQDPLQSEGQDRPEDDPPKGAGWHFLTSAAGATAGAWLET